jgi:hypothetical protein
MMEAMMEAGGAHTYSLNKAKEYKGKALEGRLQIQTLRDARGGPPKGFLLPQKLEISGNNNGDHKG